MGHQMWVYHKDHQACVVNSDEYGEMKRKGWRDHQDKADEARGHLGGLGNTCDKCKTEISVEHYLCDECYEEEPVEDKGTAENPDDINSTEGFGKGDEGQPKHEKKKGKK